METSTKNTIITGIFSISAGIIGGIFVGSNIQNNRMEHTIQQSGLININKEDSTVDIIENLLNEYINANDRLITLSDENKELQKNNEKLQEEINKLCPKNDVNNITPLINIKKLESNYFDIIPSFADYFGNTYTTTYHFDASNNAFVSYNLNKKFSKLTGYITLANTTGDGAMMTVKIFGDDEKLLKTINNISKSSISAPIFLENIDVSGVNRLTINTYNIGEYPYGHLYFTDVKLY